VASKKFVRPSLVAAAASKFLLHLACVENGKKLWKIFFFSFWLKMAPLTQGVGQKLFICYNIGSMQLFFQSVLRIPFVLSARKFNGRKVFEKI
jgi:hypothetical protein